MLVTEGLQVRIPDQVGLGEVPLGIALNYKIAPCVYLQCTALMPGASSLVCVDG